MKSIFKPIDKAFAILFLLLISVCAYHVASTVDNSLQHAPVMHVSADLQKLRSLEERIGYSIDFLEEDSISGQTKSLVLGIELERIEGLLTELGRYGVRVAGSAMRWNPIRQGHTRNAGCPEALACGP